jgi:hypothetical protein
VAVLKAGERGMDVPWFFTNNKKSPETLCPRATYATVSVLGMGMTHLRRFGLKK